MPENYDSRPEQREPEATLYPTFRITVQTREPLSKDDVEIHGKELISESELPPALAPYEVRYVQDESNPDRVFRMMGFAHTTDGLLLDRGEVVTETRRTTSFDKEEIQAGTEKIRHTGSDIKAIAEALQKNADDTVIVRRVYVPGEPMKLALSLNAAEVATYGLQFDGIQRFTSKDDREGEVVSTEQPVIILPVGPIDSTQWFRVVARTRTGRVIEVRLTQTTTDTDSLQVQQELRGLQYAVNADPEEIERFKQAMEELDAEARAEREEKLERERRRLELEKQLAEAKGTSTITPTKESREERAARRAQIEAEAEAKTWRGRIKKLFR